MQTDSDPMHPDAPTMLAPAPRSIRARSASVAATGSVRDRTTTPPSDDGDPQRTVSSSVASRRTRVPSLPPVADLSRLRTTSKPAVQPTVIRQYSLETRLGSGAFGTVWKGFNLKTGEAVAIKKISSMGPLTSSAEEHEDGMRQARDEIRIMKPLQHDHILKYFDAFEQRDPLDQYDSLFIVLEYCEIGSLNRWFKQPNLVDPEGLIAKYMGQVLDGLAYLHHQGVIHRDVKGDNILLVKNAQVKLADFGIATAVAAVQGSDKVQGTPYWMAPEALLSKPTTKSDIWSVGCVVIELMQHGAHPWYLLSDVNASYRALNGQHPAFPTEMSELGRDFLRVCFQTDQALRHEADVLGRHRWILNSKDGQPRGFYEDTASSSHRLTGSTSLASIPASPNESMTEDDWDAGGDFGLEAADLVRLDNPQAFNPNVVVVSQSQARERPRVGSISAAAASRGAPANEINVSNEEPWEQGLDIADARPLSLHLLKSHGVSKTDPVLSDTTGTDSEDDLDELERRLLEDESDAEEMEAWNRAREDAERRREEVVQLAEEISQSSDLEELERGLDRLQELFLDDARQKHVFFSAQGAFALLKLLEDEVLPLSVLRVLNVLVSNDVEAQEILCVIGLIPAVKPFIMPHCDYALRLETARFFATMSIFRGEQSRFTQAKAGFFAPRTILACGGLNVIADMLAENYNDEGKELVWLGAACVHSILGLPGRKSTFCNLLVRQAVLDPLSIALQSVVSDEQSEQAKAARRHIIQTLNILSRSDSQVRVQLAKGSIPRRLLRGIDSEHLSSQPDLLYTALQCVKNLSMTPECADGLRHGNAVEILTHLLIRHLSDEDHRATDEIITSLYYLCRLPPLQRKRLEHGPLEEAAEAGIVPVLLSVINSVSSRKSVVKPFAICMLCDMAQAGTAARQKLWPKALEQYLDMVSTDYWTESHDGTQSKGEVRVPDYHSQAQALSSISTWLQADYARIERVLLKPSNLDRLLQCVQSAVGAASTGASSDLLTPLLRLARLAPKVVNTLVSFDGFLECIQSGLRGGQVGTRHMSKNDTRLNLLRLLRMIVDTHPDGRSVLNKADLYSTLRTLERNEDEGAVIVKWLATEIVRAPSPEVYQISKRDYPGTSATNEPKRHSRSSSPIDSHADDHPRRPRVSSQTRYASGSQARSRPQGFPPPLSASRRPSKIPSPSPIKSSATRSKQHDSARSPASSISPTLPALESIPSPTQLSRLRPPPRLGLGGMASLAGRRLQDDLPRTPSSTPASSTPASSTPASISTTPNGINGTPALGRRVLRTLQTPTSVHARRRHGGSADMVRHTPQEVVSFGSALSSQHTRVQSSMGLSAPTPHNKAEEEDHSSSDSSLRLTQRAALPVAGSPSRTSLPIPDSAYRRSLQTGVGPSSYRTSIPSPQPSDRRPPSAFNGSSRRSVSSSAAVPTLQATRSSRLDSIRAQSHIVSPSTSSRPGSSPINSEGTGLQSPGSPHLSSSSPSPADRPIPKRRARIISSHSHVLGLPRTPSQITLGAPRLSPPGP